MALYPYQERVKALLLSGKSVILQAPTGSGKTRASLAPFVEAFFDHPPDFFPRKCLYSVPMRVLANQFYAEYEELVSSYRRKFRRLMTVGIQTGDRPEDPQLENNLIFTTIDQTLSNFLNIPYALGSGSANLNSGAVISSYLVFDELHLYDPDTTLPTTLEMLRMLRGVNPFIVMTATFSSQMLQRLADLLEAVVVPEDDEQRNDMEKIGSQVGKSRRFFTADEPLTAEAIFNSAGRAKRTICICNTVGAAQRLFREIKQSLEERGDRQTEVCLLHSRFYKADRDKKEQWIKDHFGIPQSTYDGPSLIAVATQVIEVGVDATCDVMHTELAPAAAILQRAGRCARRENERGDVYVYLPRTEEGEPDYTPYYLKSKRRTTQRGLRLCQSTWEALSASEFTGKHMSFCLEQALIDQVHKPVDQEILDGINATRHLHRDGMFRTMQERDLRMAAELIRNIDNRFVVVHAKPETDEKLARNPWYYDGFSFSPGSLAKAYKDLQDSVNNDETPWIMKAATRADKESGWQDEEDSRRQPEYKWYPISESGEVFSTPVLAVHPTIAHYDFDIGFVFEPSSSGHELHKRPRLQRFREYAYSRETYAEHVAGLYRAYKEGGYDQEAKAPRLPLMDELTYTSGRLEMQYGLSPGSIDRMTRALFACHDLGKLNMAWQQWAHEWQRQVGKLYPGQDMSLPENYMAAHTDYDASMDQKMMQRKLGKRPRHAGESAMAAAGVLEAVCDDSEYLWRAGMTAIARHHAASTESYHPYECHPAARAAIIEALEKIELPGELSKHIMWRGYGKKDLTQGLINFHTPQELILYLLLVRFLRLADQRSQAFGIH